MIILLIFTVLIQTIYGQANYCSPSLCSPGVQHVGCNFMGSPKNCSFPKLMYINGTHIANILKYSNTYRSQLARGLVKGFSQAAQMPQIIWNNELANLAEMSVLTCKVGDKCRNTAKFKYVGQNSMVFPSLYFYLVTEFLISRVNCSIYLSNWFGEYTNAKQSDLDVMKMRPANSLAIEHFALMVNDKVTEMGCAGMAYDVFGGYISTAIIVCNYNYANIIQKPVYTKGPQCSKCKKGCSKIYPGLCNEGEVVV